MASNNAQDEQSYKVIGELSKKGTGDHAGKTFFYQRVKLSDCSSSIYQIPNTEHMAYRLVRTLVYKRGVGIRETRFGLGFGSERRIQLG